MESWGKGAMEVMLYVNALRKRTGAIFLSVAVGNIVAD